MSAGDEFEIPESGAVFTFGRSRFSDNQPSHFFIKNDPVVDISCGDEHTVLICQKGRAFAFGSNDSGQLGLGHTRSLDKPTCVKAAKPWALSAVACGKGHTLLASKCGLVFSCGANAEGQLGLGDREDRLVPTQLNISLPDDAGPIVALAAGCLHSAFLTEGGQIWTWGGNADGQCGIDDAGDAVLVPTHVILNFSVLSIACGYYHTAFTSEDGVYTMGETDSGKLGLDSEQEKHHNIPQKVHLPDSVKPKRVAAGGSHTLLLTGDGAVYGWGSNFSGQLGAGSVPVVSTPTLSNIPVIITQIACGESHSVLLADGGTVWTCGDARHGKLCQEAGAGSCTEVTQVETLLPYEVYTVACGGCHTMVLGRSRSSQSDAESVSVRPVELPPLKARPQRAILIATDSQEQDDDVEQAGEEIFPDNTDADTVSLTESCAANQLPKTPEQEVEAQPEIVKKQEVASKKEELEEKADIPSPKKTISRMQKLVTALRIRTPPDQSKVTSKACIIL